VIITVLVYVSVALWQLFGGMFSDKDEEVQERDEFRKDRAKERQRERNIARAAPDKRFTCLSCIA